MNSDFRERICKIRMLLSDVDGVLTDGGIIFDDHGVETKCFDVKDGQGITLLQRAGIAVAWLTGRVSRVVEHRATELNIRSLLQGVKDKKAAYATWKQQAGFMDEEIAYIGDDVVDIPILIQAGVGIAVNDAVDEVKAVADYVTMRPGGHGAVREVAELILKTQNHWDRLMEWYRA